ncbi:hypothetical protein DCE79_05535 [Lysinibacillus sp. 2017]|uniref:hypothetical protein n=1 Tax=unclassified Lysinibacillus TaxID=2636778 RepID=UPI000D5299D7|nr:MULTISPECIES: hypothetical protein [unclassified Lysinibacillus]AWE06892.1 hypothetical protein DCE79_05535 [Lysinibacillus sp. 2017]TGN37177.1 hypothetical protein E4L99_01460 [Lysinibacillus sp. S2017]
MKKDWDEESIESLLTKAPKQKDHRTKEEVFQRLQSEGLFLDEPVKIEGKRKKGIRWLPLIASLAALFIIVVIATQLSGNSIQDETADSYELEAQSKEEMATSESRTMSMEKVMDSMAAQSLVYPSQLVDVTLFTIGLAGDDAESVPVSFLIPNDVVQQKIGTPNPTALQLYEVFAPLIDEQALGFNEYHPLQGKLLEKNGGLIHQVPEERPYDLGSAAISNYRGMLVDTFGNAYNEVTIQDEQGNVATFDNLGEMTQPISLTDASTHYNYFAYQKRDSSIYLSPNFRMSYTNVEEALKNMTTEANDIYQTVILPDVTFQTKVENEQVVITFDQTVDLESYDSMQAMRMIEGILLTAASFDKQVQFKNMQPVEWKGFDFTKPLEKPISANLIQYDFFNE